MEGRRSPERPGWPAAPVGCGWSGVRAQVLRRRLSARRADLPGGAEPRRGAGPGGEAHPDGPGCVALSEEAVGAAGRDRARALLGRDLPRMHPGLPVLSGRHDHPAGAGAQHRGDRCHGRGRDRGHGAGGGGPSQLVQRRSLRDRRYHSPAGRSLPGYERLAIAAQHSSRCLQHRPCQRTVAQWPSIGPDVRSGGRLRAAAYSHGWRQVKLYFMCGLPTETDDDVLAIADLAKKVVATGRSVSGRRDIRCTVSIGAFVPKPHTPFQWAGQCDHETVDGRLAKLMDAIRKDRQYGRAIGFRYHDGKPSAVEGLLSRGDRRVRKIIEAVWRDGGRFDGWSEHFSYDRWVACAESALAGTGVDLDWYTTRERHYDEVLPWDHLDSGLDRDWLWDDWQDALEEVEVDDCRWTPCFDCGVCPQLDTTIQIGPTGRSLLPIAAVTNGLA